MQKFGHENMCFGCKTLGFVAKLVHFSAQPPGLVELALEAHLAQLIGRLQRFCRMFLESLSSRRTEPGRPRS